MNRCSVLLCRLNHLEQTRRIAIDPATNMNEDRRTMARGYCEDHVSLGIVYRPGHVIE